MKLIAKRTNSLIWLFGLATAGLALELFLAYESLNIIGIAVLIILIIIGASLFVYQITRHREIITLNRAQGTIYLHHENISLKILSIKSVSYRKAISGHSVAGWGKIILKTTWDEYECNYVDEVEKVANELNTLISIEKRKNEE